MDTGDTAWVLMSSALVMLMTPALGFFYGGLVRRKNVLATIMHSFFILALISVQWALWGYTLAFGPDKGGVIGGIMLGLGRALGETMAVTFVIGNFNQLDSLSLFAPANSITSALANEFAEAASGLHQAAPMYLGLVLFFITFVVLSLSKVLLARLRKGEGARS